MRSREHTVAIPNAPGWQARRFDELCSMISRGTAPVYVEHSPVAAIGQRCVATNGFDADNARAHSARSMQGVLVPAAGDVLLNSTGTGTIGRSCVFQHSGSFIVDGHVTLMRPRRDVAVGRWLDAILRSPWGQTFLETRCYSGSTNQIELARGALASGSVPCPPLPEQRAIAAVLDTLDDAIEKTEQTIAKLQQVKHGLLQDLLTRGIDDSGELRDSARHPEQFEGSPLGQIAKSWRIVPLHQVAEIRSGLAKNEGRAVRDPIDVHYLRVANVQDGYLDLSDVATIRVSRNEVDRFRVLKGDVLMNEGGDLDKLGRGTIWRGEFEPCIHQNHVFVVRCGGDLLPEFLDAWTLTRHARRYFLVAGKQTTNLASINKTALGDLPVIVPPLAEQQAAVAAVAALDGRVTNESALLGKLRMMRVGIAEDLLTGRVRTTALPERTT